MNTIIIMLALLIPIVGHGPGAHRQRVKCFESRAGVTCLYRVRSVQIVIPTYSDIPYNVRDDTRS